MRHRSVMRPSRPSRRDFLAMAAAAGVAVPLIGCAGGVTDDGGSDDGTPAPGGNLDQVDVSPPSQYAGRVNVAMWSAMGGVNGEALAALVEKFNQSQEDVYAEVQFQGAYAESAPKLTAALRAGAVPDVMMLADTFWGRFLINDALEPLNGYFDDDFGRDDYVEALYDEGLVGDELYWLSFGRSTPLFYYNKNVFQQAGLPDRGPDTWSELREWSSAISQLTVNGQPLKAHAFTGDDDWQFMAAVWQFGGRLSDGLDVTIDSGGAVDAARWHQQYIFEDGYGYLAQASGTDFGTGVVATTITSTGGLRGIYEAAATAGFEVGTAFLPKEVASGVPTGGMGFSLLRGAAQERKDAAFQLLKFLGQPENAAEWTLATGYLPIVKASMDVPELAQTLSSDPNFSVAVEQLPEAQGSDAIRSFLPNGTDLIISGLQRIYSDGSEDPQDVFDEVAEQLRQGVEDIRPAYEEYFG
ncbi:ABC transporter substrate-binding protein [Jiangella alkaliphila]|uniref:Carbohydrate ABC transporter substrate-binding protein, CUT1 family n=2 Tax=Jiangella alkaliphila TaxID=419479 RepID=A0A1H2JNH1_9ACTN|nr:ABC transporter substrate-binding protein [Jiangella alkaliphila]SDU57892.1 carbohydrate ABC transporter substrate-binding protein, CUT1 family [Jiangella alkaliphila]